MIFGPVDDFNVIGCIGAWMENREPCFFVRPWSQMQLTQSSSAAESLSDSNYKLPCVPGAGPTNCTSETTGSATWMTWQHPSQSPNSPRGVFEPDWTARMWQGLNDSDEVISCFSNSHFYFHGGNCLDVW